MLEQANSDNLEKLRKDAKLKIALSVYNFYQEMNLDLGQSGLSEEEIREVEELKEQFGSIRSKVLDTVKIETDKIQEEVARQVEEVMQREIVKEENVLEEKEVKIPKENIVKRTWNKIESKKQEEFLKRLEENLKNTTISNSVKPGFEVPLNVSKRIMPKAEYLAKIGAFLLAGGITALSIFEYKDFKEKADVVGPILIEYEKDILYNEDNFKEKISLVDSSYYDLIHWHEIKDVIAATKERFEDPNVALYMIYYSLDDYCRQEHKFKEFLDDFNYEYGTYYESFEDFLEKNNFKKDAYLIKGPYKDFMMYVYNSLADKEILKK